MKRRISMTTRKELTEALRSRYRSATFGDRVKILDEFVALTGITENMPFVYSANMLQVPRRRPSAIVFTMKRYGRHSPCYGRPLIVFAVSV